MKTSILGAAVLACALVVPMASAVDKTTPAKPAIGMHADAEHSKMHANMTEMKAQMTKIHATTNLKERQKLMASHMQAMQANMSMMGSMSKSMMDGGHGDGMPMHGEKSKQGDKDMMDGNMMKQHQAMQERMDMMQMMMDQMLQHQQAMESMPVK